MSECFSVRLLSFGSIVCQQASLMVWRQVQATGYAPAMGVSLPVDRHSDHVRVCV